MLSLKKEVVDLGIHHGTPESQEVERWPTTRKRPSHFFFVAHIMTASGIVVSVYLWRPLLATRAVALVQIDASGALGVARKLAGRPPTITFRSRAWSEGPEYVMYTPRRASL